MQQENGMSPKTWEVELKFHVAQPAVLEENLVACGFDMVELQQHEDIYLRHPCRDFVLTDEALRIRRVNNQACMTYKGPRSAGVVKTREEIELAIDSAALDDWLLLVNKLGFQQVVPVRKTRRIFECRSNKEFAEIHVTIDCVEHLGNFAEIEIVVSDTNGVKAAEQRVLSLAELLELKEMQPRSYLTMLLDAMK
jgi:adenylate cyclase class 2